MKNRIYLDFAAATPLDSSVSKRMREAEKYFANPSSLYQSGRQSAKILEAAKKTIAMHFGVNSHEVVFTSGATESNNLAILGTVLEPKRSRVISVATEHSSIQEPLKYLQSLGCEVVNTKVSKTGKIDLTAFEKNINQNTKLVSISFANSEIGTIQKLNKISQIIKKYEEKNNTTILFHSDCSAAVNTLNCDINKLGLNLATFSSSKIYGPAGIGALYVKRGTKIKPLIYGGNQQNGIRSGSENLTAIVGFAEALKIVKERAKFDSQKFRQLYTQFVHQLREAVSFLENGDPKERLFSVVNISFEGLNGENLVAYLDSQGIEVSTGAACEVSSEEPSLALQAIGLSALQAQGSLRISFGRTTSHKDIDFLIQKLIGIIKR